MFVCVCVCLSAEYKKIPFFIVKLFYLKWRTFRETVTGTESCSCKKFHLKHCPTTVLVDCRCRCGCFLMYLIIVQLICVRFVLFFSHKRFLFFTTFDILNAYEWTIYVLTLFNDNHIFSDAKTFIWFNLIFYYFPSFAWVLTVWLTFFFFI